MTMMCTTRLEFDDGHLEGQVLHVGTPEECRQVADAIDAISYSGDGKIIDSRLVIIPNTGNWPKGHRWGYRPQMEDSDGSE